MFTKINTKMVIKNIEQLATLVRETGGSANADIGFQMLRYLFDNGEKVVSVADIGNHFKMRNIWVFVPLINTYIRRGAIEYQWINNDQFFKLTADFQKMVNYECVEH